MNRKIVVVALAASLVLSGCATSSRDIATAYVSPLQYQNFDCDQLGMEAQRLTGRVQQLGGRLDEAANNDRAIAGIGIILFWPTLFALGGTKQQEAEYARLKGEAEALQHAAVARKCIGTNSVVAIAPATTTPQSPLQVTGGEILECVRQGLVVGDRVSIPGHGQMIIREIKNINTHCPGTNGNLLPVVVTRESAAPVVPFAFPTPLNSGLQTAPTVSERLRALKKLHDDNLISRETYEVKQREILLGQ